MSRTRIYWSLQISGWSFFAFLIIILSLLFAGTIDLNKILYALIISCWYLLSSHIFRNLIRKWKWLELRIAKTIPLTLFTAFILSISNYFIHILSAYELNMLDYPTDFELYVIITYIFGAMVFYLLWALIYYIYHYIERYNYTLKFEALKNEIELNKLKSQLNPHFIFNALNSIRALVDENPDKSKTAITQLSSILRNSLILNKQELTTFNEELNAVKDYLALETIRFEERLQTVIEIDPRSLNYKIPPLMLQTLVENGIKHGISHLKEGGTIKIKTEIINSDLYIKIWNNGHLELKNIENPKGFGIENTKQRLKLLFNDNATFTISNESENMVLTEIKIPQVIQK